MDGVALLLSLKLALATTLLLLLAGIPVAAWIAFSRRRWKFLVEAVVALPLVLPPTVLGLCVLVALGPKSPLGRLWEAATGHGLAFTFEGLLLASVLYSLPFAVQPFASAFASVEPSLLEASWCLGVSRAGTFLRVVLPLSRRGLVTGAVLSFAHTLGEFGVVLMVGGNIPGLTRTASISIYDDVQALDYGRAGATAMLLLAVSVTVLLLTYGLRRDVRGTAPWR
ncbi:MAG: molybdate ABC transporter permease subunit [Acidithiobacillales bacterium]